MKEFKEYIRERADSKIKDLEVAIDKGQERVKTNKQKQLDISKGSETKAQKETLKKVKKSGEKAGETLQQRKRERDTLKKAK